MDLTDLLRTLATEHGIVGAQLAVLSAGATTDAVHGVLNVDTGQEVTEHSVFQIGSITKVWTASLVVQLVDEGLVRLSDPVTQHLPDVDLPNPDVTVGHLLDHTNGIDGDLFLDTGRGDDAVERYVRAMADLRSLHPVGSTMSYSNSAYALAGHLVATLRGTTWETVLRERLIQPLGLERAGSLPEEALRHAVACGHADGERVPVWGIWRSAGPAGSIHATAREVLAFAAMHTSGGGGLLSPESVALMQQPRVAIPGAAHEEGAFGLGWHLHTWDGRRVFGHDGGTLGQLSFLRVLPDLGISVCLLTNGGPAAPMFSALLSELLPSLGAPTPPAGPPTDGSVLPEEHRVGRYEKLCEVREVLLGNGGLRIRVTSSNPLPGGDPEPVELPLEPIAPDHYIADLDGARIPVVFQDHPDGRVTVHVGVGLPCALTQWCEQCSLSSVHDRLGVVRCASATSSSTGLPGPLTRSLSPPTAPA